MPCDRCIGERFQERCRHEKPQTARSQPNTPLPRFLPDVNVFAAHSGGQPLGTPRLGYWPGTACTQHPEYPLPCVKCQRDSLNPMKGTP
ncbi:hypothetical protein FHX48_000696 [Microbacterium halimionae]|uniref:Uncharacterized protein n=1 Tax=Microbacterium halimionae TaxID=1526413 RepID=A0A7W3JMT2_9MICO|nr:hypothetical protein [Microbacterium halimionae]NII95691.1 hypothetical protein [Microbacterium halimionae]